MVRNNARRRRTTRANASTPRRLKRAVDRIETGVRFVPSADPPEYSRAPWWPLTVVDSITEATQYTYKTLMTGILTAMGYTAAQQTAVGANFYEVRVQTVRVWGLAKQAISLSPQEIVGAGTHRMRQLADMGSGINFSRLGWRFGSVSRIDPNVNEDVYICHVGGDLSATKKALVYFQVLVCTSVGPQPKTLMSSVPTDDIAASQWHFF